MNQMDWMDGMDWIDWMGCQWNKLKAKFYCENKMMCHLRRGIGGE